MAGGILITGNESLLFSALCVEAAKRADRYAAALIPFGQFQKSKEIIPGDRKIMLDWNPSSPVSAKNLVLSVQNSIGGINNALLVCMPPAFRKRADKLTAEEIDTFIDYNIKGWFFLVRELSAAFEKHKQGTLSLVVPAEPNTGAREDEYDLAGPIAISAFRSFAQGILFSSINAPYNTMGFSSPEPGEENAFAAFMFKTIDEGKKNSGKWHKYGKFSLFGH